MLEGIARGARRRVSCASAHAGRRAGRRPERSPRARTAARSTSTSSSRTRECWDLFTGHQQALADSGLGEVAFAAPFIPTIPGTDTYVSQELRVGEAHLEVLTDLFPTRVRFSGVALGFNVAFTVFSGTAPLVATSLIRVTGLNTAPAFVMVGCGLITLVGSFWLSQAGGHVLSK